VEEQHERDVWDSYGGQVGWKGSSSELCVGGRRETRLNALYDQLSQMAIALVHVQHEAGVQMVMIVRKLVRAERWVARQGVMVMG
jgi:hypothetical protein